MFSNIKSRKSIFKTENPEKGEDGEESSYLENLNSVSLIEMKQAVYPEVKLHSDAIKQQPGFRHIQRQRLSYPLTITDATQLDNLLQMVPLAWKFTSENRQAFVQATRSISIDFLLDVYQRNDLAC